MFNIFKKKPIDKNIDLYAPVNGTLVDIETVQDPAFANKVTGDGVAFSFDEDFICAPADGKISVIAETRHAFAMKFENGVEILIHIGLNTVNLGGKGFRALVSEGKKVKAGTPIIQIDRKIISEYNVDLTTPMIVTEPNGYKLKILSENRDVKLAQTVVIKLEKE